MIIIVLIFDVWRILISLLLEFVDYLVFCKIKLLFFIGNLGVIFVGGVFFIKFLKDDISFVNGVFFFIFGCVVLEKNRFVKIVKGGFGLLCIVLIYCE